MTTAAAPASPAPPASTPAQAPGRPRLHPWTFNQLINAQDEDGRLNRQRVELIDGKVYDMAPRYNPHIREAEYGGRYQAYEIVDESGWPAPTIEPEPPLRVAEMLT